MIIVDDNLFDDTFITLFDEYCTSNQNWFFGRKGSLAKDNVFWGSILYEEGWNKNFFVEYIFRKFIDKHNIKAEILSCVLNGQTAGQNSTWHVDLYENENFPDNKFTLLYYVNKYWTDEHSGATIIKIPNSQQEELVQFVPGRVLFFPSGYQHQGFPPKELNKLRITCAYKLNLLETL